MTVATIELTLPARDSPSDDPVLRLRPRRADDDDEVALRRSDLIRAANRDGGARSAFFRSRSGTDGAYVRCRALVPIAGSDGGEKSALGARLPTIAVVSASLPTVLLIACAFSYVTSSASGYDAVFPSTETAGVVVKIAVWSCLAIAAVHQNLWFWSDPAGYAYGAGPDLKLIVTLEGWASEGERVAPRVAAGKRAIQGGGRLHPVEHDTSIQKVREMHTRSIEGFDVGLSDGSGKGLSESERTEKTNNSRGLVPAAQDGNDGKAENDEFMAGKEMPVAPVVTTREAEMENMAMERPEQEEVMVATSRGAEGETSIRSVDSSGSLHAPVTQELPPPRFINAEKGDILSAQRRYQETLAWRAEMGMDTILSKPHPNFAVIKKNYPHFYHLRGKNNEPCYYESPPKMNLKALQAAGLTMDDLLRHYAITCEFMWTYIEPSEEGKSIYIIDLAGIGIRDFAGDVVDFVKKTSAFTSAHYPERSGSIFIINVPSWFSIIWNTVKPWVDEVTRKKIKILRYGASAITKALEEKIDIENIPPEYGGRSMPLGQSPEEDLFREKMESNNRREQDSS